MYPPVRLSPAAEAVAYWLLGMPKKTKVYDWQIAVPLGLEDDTVYRALGQLERAGALTFTRSNRSQAPRDITLLPHPWIWARAKEMRELVQL